MTPKQEAKEKEKFEKFISDHKKRYHLVPQWAMLEAWLVAKEESEEEIEKWPIAIVKHPIDSTGKPNRSRTYCYHCGTHVKNQKFCHGCGHKLDWNMTSNTELREVGNEH